MGDKKGVSGLVAKAEFFVKDFFAHWNTPKKGEYVSNKEFASFAIGGMGVQGFYALMLYTALNAGQKLSAIYGFSPNLIYITGIFTAVLTILISPLRGWIIDNLSSKHGKFRPYLKWLGPPCLILFWSLAFIPQWIVSGMTADPEAAKLTALIVYQVIYFIANVLVGFYTMGMTSLVNVITPNGDERAKIQSIGALLYSIGPSITQLFFPIIAQAIYGERAWESIGTYQWIFPVFGLLFMLLGYVCYFGTRERLVVEKSYKPKVKFFEGLKDVAKNKYFWIINSALILGFGRLMIIGTQYYVAVDMLKSTALEGAFTTIIATASIPAMLFGPILLKKWDKKKWVISSYLFTSLVSAFMLLLTYVGFDWGATPWIFLVLMYVNTLLSTINIVVAPLINAEYLDFTQLKTGRRLDGFMGQVGAILVTVVGMGTGYLIPALVTQGGLVVGNEYGDSIIGMTVLRNSYIAWGWVSVICGILAALPYFFYDLNEDKHKKIIEALRTNALKKDFEDGNLREEDYPDALRLGVIDENFVMLATGNRPAPESEAIFETDLARSRENAIEEALGLGEENGGSTAESVEKNGVSISEAPVEESVEENGETIAENPVAEDGEITSDKD